MRATTRHAPPPDRRTPPLLRFALALLPFVLAARADAGLADVVAAEAQCEGARCTFLVTVRHGDEGWDHYADRYEVRDEAGDVLGTRVLRHPHVDEQPFTRSLAIDVPQKVRSVRIRAHDSKHGEGGRGIALDLER